MGGPPPHTAVNSYWDWEVWGVGSSKPKQYISHVIVIKWVFKQSPAKILRNLKSQKYYTKFDFFPPNVFLQYL